MRLLTHLTGEKTFRLATLSILALLVLFLVVIIASLVAYTDRHALLSTLVSDEILFAIKLSLTTATVATIFSMVIAIPVAYAVSQADFPGKDIIDTILDLPIVISPVALGAALLVFFNTPIGSAIENRLLGFVFEVPGIVLAQFTVVVALAIRLLKSTFDSIDPRYEQVGRTLGCSKGKGVREGDSAPGQERADRGRGTDVGQGRRGIRGHRHARRCHKDEDGDAPGRHLPEPGHSQCGAGDRRDLHPHRHRGRSAVRPPQDNRQEATDMIAVKNLSARLGDFSLKEVNLDIRDGEYFVILGPTGAGKTVLIECLAGLHRLTSGELWIDHRNVTS